MMLRRYVVMATRSCLGTLPRSVQRVLFHALTMKVDNRDAWSGFFDLCKRLPVDSVTVETTLGRIAGSPRDNLLFRPFVATGEYVPELIALFRAALIGGGTYIDIGANIGLTLLPIATLPNVRCIAFEPDPLTFSFLARNVETNCADDAVTLHRLAIFDKATTVCFERSADNFGDHRIRVNNNDGLYGESRREVIEVATKRLDDAVNLVDLRRPIVIKIDTQGAEPFVFAGGTRTLAAADLMVLEVWPYGARRLGGDFIASVVPLITSRFDEGCIALTGFDNGRFQMHGEKWRPMSEFVTILTERFSSIDQSSGEQFDIWVRKTPPRRSSNVPTS
jgi:FkbM family methyltransferase